jgi:hypothetical protein
MALQNLEQLHQSQRRLGFSILVAGKRVDSTAEYFGGLPLIERKFLAHAADELRSDYGCVDLLIELQHQRAGTGRLRRPEDGLATGRAELARYLMNDRTLALVGIGDVARVQYQFRFRVCIRASNRAARSGPINGIWGNIFTA